MNTKPPQRAFDQYMNEVLALVEKDACGFSTVALDAREELRMRSMVEWSFARGESVDSTADRVARKFS